MADLFASLSKFQPCNDVESKTAYFKTHVPWEAPQAYLNIIFKPVSVDVLKSAERELVIPESLAQFFGDYNGAILLSGAVSIYGVHAPGQLLDRQDPFARLPFDIKSENDDWPPKDAENFLAFGGYQWDGSSVCINRIDQTVHLFERDRRGLKVNPKASWPSFEVWLKSEVERISFLFDEVGRRLVVDGSATLPSVVALN